MRRRAALAAVVGLFLGLVVVLGAQVPAQACRPVQRHGVSACGPIAAHAHHRHHHHRGEAVWMPWWMFVRFTGGPR